MRLLLILNKNQENCDKASACYEHVRNVEDCKAATTDHICYVSEIKSIEHVAKATTQHASQTEREALFICADFIDDKSYAEYEKQRCQNDCYQNVAAEHAECSTFVTNVREIHPVSNDRNSLAERDIATDQYFGNLICCDDNHND